MRKKYIMTGVLFIILVGWGMALSSQRPLWNDEYYSLLASIHNVPFFSILKGDIGEGDNSPLFYVLQKIQCDLFSYHPPQQWLEGHWTGEHVFDQLFLRIQSVVFMAAALSALFYYFARRNSWAWGIYALAVAMTSSLFWDHWTEARPYALWLALSQFQILFLLNILEDDNNQNNKSWNCFYLVHWFLALTTILSIIQIMAAGAVLWRFKNRKTFWVVPMILVPLGICTFYYAHATQYKFFFVNGPIDLINANVPKERLFIIFMAAMVLIVQSRGKKWTSHLENKYLIFFLLMMGAFGLLVMKLKYGQAQGQQGFEISSRYFLSLLPAGIVGVVLFSGYLIRAFPSKAWKSAAIIILACFLIFRFHQMTEQVPINHMIFFHLTHNGI